MQRQHLAIVGAASAGAATQIGTDVAGEATLASGLFIVFDVTALAGGGTLQVVVELKDNISGKYVSLGTFTAVGAVGTYTYAIGLGVQAAADGVTAVRGFPVPDTYRLRVVGAATITNTSYTLSSQRV
jgi:hypothetical protein